MATLSQGATSLAAANWSDATGFDDDAVLLITEEGSQAITAGLDQTGATTTGIHSLRGGGQFRGTVGGSGANLQVEIQTSAGISGPNLHISSGTWYVAAVTTTLDSAVVDGGTVYFNGTSTIAKLVVQAGARVVIGEGVTVTTLINAGGSVKAADGTAFTTARVTGGNLTSEREATTLDAFGGSVALDSRAGNSGTINNSGGLVRCLSGDVGTYNGYAGTLDVTATKEVLEIGTTATVLYPAAVILGENRTDVTISNITREGTPLPTGAQLPGGGFSGT